MSVKLRAEFAIRGWDESPIDAGTGVSKLTEALVEKIYSGDIEGTSVTKWLMAYAPDKTAVFVGLERIRGSFAGRHGSLVLRHLGTFEGTTANAALTVVSGTNELKTVSGKGKFLADPAGSVTLTLEFS